MATKTKSFEESIARLEAIVKLLESGEASLDESIKLYSEGVKLVGECNKKLDAHCEARHGKAFEGLLKRYFK